MPSVEECWAHFEIALRERKHFGIRFAVLAYGLAAYRLGAYRRKGEELYCDRCDATLGVTEHKDSCYTLEEEAQLEALGQPAEARKGETRG